MATYQPQFTQQEIEQAIDSAQIDALNIIAAAVKKEGQKIENAINTNIANIKKEGQKIEQSISASYNHVVTGFINTYNKNEGISLQGEEAKTFNALNVANYVPQLATILTSIPVAGIVNQYAPGEKVVNLKPGQTIENKTNRFIINDGLSGDSNANPVGNLDSITTDNNWNDNSPYNQSQITGNFSDGNFRIISPLIFNLSQVAGTGTTQSDISTGRDSSMVNLLLKQAMITITQNKNIIDTKIMGKNGTVKEYIGLDDYKIKIEGTLFGKNGQYPKDDVILLRKYCDQINTPIWITCDYLWDLIGINYIVIKSYNIDMKSGVSQQRYEIEAVSDNFYDTDLNFNLNPYKNY